MFVLWTWAAAPALAQTVGEPTGAEDPSDPAEIERRGVELYENGAMLYDEGRYEDAIVAWTEGYRLTQRSGFLFNVANAQERLGDYQGAIDTLGRYRALAKTEERETLDRRIRNLEQRLAAAPAPAPDGVQPVPAPGASDPLVRDPPPGRAPDRRRWVGGALVGGGAVGVGLGAAFALQSRAAGADVRALCVEGADGTTLCPATASDRLAANRRGAALADVGFALGAVLAGSGAVVWLTAGPESVGWQVGPGSASIVGRF